MTGALYISTAGSAQGDCPADTRAFKSGVIVGLAAGIALGLLLFVCLEIRRRRTQPTPGDLRTQLVSDSASLAPAREALQFRRLAAGADPIAVLRIDGAGTVAANGEYRECTNDQGEINNKPQYCKISDESWRICTCTIPGTENNYSSEAWCFVIGHVEDTPVVRTGNSVAPGGCGITIQTGYESSEHGFGADAIARFTRVYEGAHVGGQGDISWMGRPRESGWAVGPYVNRRNGSFVPCIGAAPAPRLTWL